MIIEFMIIFLVLLLYVVYNFIPPVVRDKFEICFMNKAAVFVYLT